MDESENICEKLDEAKKRLNTNSALLVDAFQKAVTDTTTASKNEVTPADGQGQNHKKGKGKGKDSTRSRQRSGKGYARKNQSG